MFHLDKASNRAVQEETCIQMMEDDPPSKLESADSMVLSAIETQFIVVEGGGRGNVNTAGIMQSNGRRGPGGDTDSINYVDKVINEENVEDDEEETTSFIKKGKLSIFRISEYFRTSYIILLSEYDGLFLEFKRHQRSTNTMFILPSGKSKI